MNQHNPPHPGEFIARNYVEAMQLSKLELASKLGLGIDILDQLLSGKLAVDKELAERLSNTLGRSAEVWLLMQQHYDNFNRS